MLRKLLISLLFVAFSPAFADAVAKNGSGDYVRLTQSACPKNIAELVPEQFRAALQAGVANVAGKDYKLCWLLNDDQVLIQYEDGDRGTVDASAFKSVPAV